jgi:hypothetical protein
MNITTQRIWLSDIGFGLIIVSYPLLVFSSPMPIKNGATEITMGGGLTIGALFLGFSFIAKK